MQSEKQKAEPTPSLSAKSEQYLPLMEKLSLQDKNQSQKSTEKNYTGRTKQIQKGPMLKRKYKQGTTRNKQASKKQINRLEHKVADLQGQIDRMKRKMECCHNCRNFNDNSVLDGMKDGIGLFGGDSQRQDRQIQQRRSLDSHGSLEFENIDFLAPYMHAREMDQRSWIYLGTMMIAMGSCSLDFDGGINVFKILKESIDSLRRQVEKSEPNISMDFYLSSESMEDSNGMMQSDDIGFDPFINKYDHCSGLALEGVKVESVEQFQLIYDNKVKFNLKYEALIAAMEHVREHCWVSMEN